VLSNRVETRYSTYFSLTETLFHTMIAVYHIMAFLSSKILRESTAIAKLRREHTRM
jgi:hypothetical protein